MTLITEEKHQALQKQAALKSKQERILTIEEARAYSKKLIYKWSKDSRR